MTEKDLAAHLFISMTEKIPNVNLEAALADSAALAKLKATAKAATRLAQAVGPELRLDEKTPK